jgi:hypothetical protein
VPPLGRRRSRCGGNKSCIVTGRVARQLRGRSNGAHLLELRRLVLVLRRRAKQRRRGRELLKLLQLLLLLQLQLLQQLLLLLLLLLLNELQLVDKLLLLDLLRLLQLQLMEGQLSKRTGVV